MATLFEVMAIFQGLGAYALGAEPGLVSGSAALLYSAGLMLTLFGLAKAFSAFILPLGEYARILAPPAPTENPRPVSRGRIAMASAVVSFVIGFVYFPAVAYFERSIAVPPREMPATPAPTVVQPVAEVREVMERIDDVVVRAGTIDRAQTLRTELLEQIRARQAALEPLARVGFAGMRGNVPAYLDAYYGLAAEYARMGQLLIGEYEPYVEEQLRFYLEQNAPFAPFETELAEMETFIATATADYQAAVARLVAENRVDNLEGISPDLAAATTSGEILGAFQFDDVITFPTRFKASIAAGAVTVGAVVVAKAMTKLTAKGTLQLAGMALAKLAGGKLAAGGAGTVVGAFIGGGIGSLIPGAGTAAGAFIGGAIGGIAVGVGADYLLLKLEEELSREEFQAEIIAAIDAAEADFLAALR
jgi:hypothetical protein